MRSDWDEILEKLQRARGLASPPALVLYAELLANISNYLSALLDNASSDPSDAEDFRRMAAQLNDAASRLEPNASQIELPTPGSGKNPFRGYRDHVTKHSMN